jgi:hypothetical protein
VDWANDVAPRTAARLKAANARVISKSDCVANVSALPSNSVDLFRLTTKRETILERDTPHLASPQGGVAASSKKFREATETDAAGVVFIFFAVGKPPRLRGQRMLRDIFLLAQTPLLAVMQGGESLTEL